MNMDIWLDEAEKGSPVYIHTVREMFAALPDAGTIQCVLTLPQGRQKQFSLYLPDGRNVYTDREKLFLKDYLYACIYNILSAWGGCTMTIYYDFSDPLASALLRDLPGGFGAGIERSCRRGYGKVLNVIDRMLQYTMPDADHKNAFMFEFHPAETFRSVLPGEQKEAVSGSRVRDPGKAASLHDRFLAAADLGDRTICGMDIGGTDIKIAVSTGSRIQFYKEFDWYPASFTRIDQLVKPVHLLMRLVTAKLTLEEAPVSLQNSDILQLMTEALERDADYSAIETAVLAFETEFPPADRRKCDAVGLCFPDVVVRNKIVGGEVYKTRGIRNNPDIDYEQEFSHLAELHEQLECFCKTQNSVHITNDGPMASFTAAVEMAHSGDDDALDQGVFCHTLGTELGTGWIDAQGVIPEIPLEIYNFIIDLGNYPERAYEPDDVRSINNFNTGLPGTLQKYTSQSGVFRLAVRYLQASDSPHLSTMEEMGFLKGLEDADSSGVYVPTEPIDMRKPFLEYLMNLAASGEVPELQEVFVEIGRQLGVTWQECETILHPRNAQRVLFGRMVKNPACLALMQKGAAETAPEGVFSAADDDLAASVLMKQLQKDTHYTVAQFAQAVGAIYFGNIHTRRMRDE